MPKGKALRAKVFNRIAIIAAIILGTAFYPVEAGEKIVLEDNGELDQKEVKALARELGLAFSAIPLAPAEPLGVLGIDVGFGFSVADIRDEKSCWKDAISDGNPPRALILPQFTIRKGVPGGVDLGMVYTPKVFGSEYKLLGAEAKWAFILGSMLTPALAVRLDYHRSFGPDNFTIQTFTTDLSISKGLGLITAYTGVGMVFIYADPDGGGFQLSRHRGVKGYAGTRFNLGFIQIGPEIDLARNFLVYSLKVGLILGLDMFGFG